MKTKTSKLLTLLAVFSLLGLGYASADADDSIAPCDPCYNEFFATCGDGESMIVLPKKSFGVDNDNCNAMFCVQGPETQKLTFGGLIQSDFIYIDVNDRSTGDPASSISPNDPTERMQFLMRRANFGMRAVLGDCFYGVVNMYLDTPCSTCSSTDSDCNASVGNRLYGLDRAYVEKVYAGNSFRAGYDKVMFGVEENTPSSKLKTFERSVVTNYFNEPTLPCNATCNAGNSTLGFGSRRVGLFLNGEHEYFGYGAAVTNSFPGLGESSLYANEIGLYGNLYYSVDLNGLGATGGVNAGYQPEGNTLWMTTAGYCSEATCGTDDECTVVANDEATNIVKRSGVIGFNPYGMLYWNGFTIIGELVLAHVENGQLSTRNTATINQNKAANPYGFNFIASYMWNDCLELVVRFSKLDTDKRGVRISNVYNNAPDVVIDADTLNCTDIFNQVSTFYIGLNYYVMNKAVKFMLGYERAAFQGRWGTQAGSPCSSTGISVNSFNGHKADVNAVRARVQLVF